MTVASEMIFLSLNRDKFPYMEGFLHGSRIFFSKIFKDFIIELPIENTCVKGTLLNFLHKVVKNTDFYQEILEKVIKLYSEDIDIKTQGKVNFYRII